METNLHEMFELLFDGGSQIEDFSDEDVNEITHLLLHCNDKQIGENYFVKRYRPEAR